MPEASEMLEILCSKHRATNEEVLNAARFYGQQDGKLLDHPQPLCFLCWMSRFITISEILCQEVIAAYQAGYRSK